MTPPTFNQILAELLGQGWPLSVALREARDRAALIRRLTK